MDVFEYQKEKATLAVDGGYRLLCSVFGKSKLPIIIFSTSFEPVYYNRIAFEAYRLLCLRDTLISYVGQDVLDKVCSEVTDVGLSRVELTNNGLFSSLIFTAITICGNKYLRLQIEEKRNFSENIKHLFAINDLNSVIQNEILGPATNIQLLLPLFRKSCYPTKAVDEKFTFMERNLYSLTRSARKIAEMVNVILNVFNVSTQAARITDLIHTAEKSGSIKSVISEDIADAVALTDLNSFSNITSDIICYMNSLKSVLVRDREVLLEVYTDNGFVVFEFSRRSVSCPDMDHIFEMTNDIENLSGGYYKIRAIAELNGYGLDVHYEKRQKMFITKLSLPMLFFEKAEDMLSDFDK